MAKINWLDKQNHLLLNEKLTLEDKDKWTNAFDFACKTKEIKGHIFLLTSGTSGLRKLVAISKKAFLASAKSVNDFLQVDEGDKWLNPLPSHHVGGLSIYCRAYLTKSHVEEIGFWDPIIYHQLLSKDDFKFSSLVPTQVFDLIEYGRPCPKHVKAIVVGGSHLPAQLYERARDLGYPILPSFGASELSSQIATAKVGSKDLHLLSHIEARVEGDGRFWVRSPALFSFYVFADFRLEEPKLVDGYFRTEDHVKIEDGILTPLGRSSDYVKVLGEAVSLHRLDEEVRKLCDIELAVVARANERRGHDLILAVAEVDVRAAKEACISWNKQALGFERISALAVFRKLDRNDMGKISKKEILANIERKNFASFEELDRI